jgi:hypothetical protein
LIARLHRRQLDVERVGRQLDLARLLSIYDPKEGPLDA